MKTLFLLIAIFSAIMSDGYEDAVLAITGASSIEELDESTMERFRILHEHPVDINAAGRSRLLSCGLFTQYQVATMLDWRERSGDILSWNELSLVAGFNREIAGALCEFVVFRTKSAPGQRVSDRISHDLMVRASVRTEGDGAPVPAGGLKYSLSIGERFEFNWGTRITYSDRKFTPGTMSAAYYGRGHLGKVVVGDFNARFGQGLALWSGFRLSGFTSVQAFRRNPGGISASSSYTGSLRGAAADFNFGGWTLSAAYSYPATGIANVCWTGRNASVGATVTNGRASVDARIGLPGTSLFGEVMFNGEVAAVAGMIRVPGYGQRYGVMARYAEGESELAAGYGNPWLNCIADLSYDRGESSFKGRLTTVVSPAFTVGTVGFKPSVRAVVRYAAASGSGRWKLDLRGDVSASCGAFGVNGRFNYLHSDGHSRLWYIEPFLKSDVKAGRGSDTVSAYLRFTLFRIDDWDDRIYSYERDAPGNFTCPAYYGRGWSMSAYATWKFLRRHTVCLRASMTKYPWNPVPKDSRVEVKLQYCVSL